MDSSKQLSVADKKGMIDRAITSALAAADGEAALHAFCFSIQGELGVTDGGPAGIFFSGPLGEEVEEYLDGEIKWIARRGGSGALSKEANDKWIASGGDGTLPGRGEFILKMIQYIDFELMYLGEEDDGDEN